MSVGTNSGPQKWVAFDLVDPKGEVDGSEGVYPGYFDIWVPRGP